MSKIATRCAADIAPETVEFLFYPYIPKGKITIVAGMEGSGKSVLMMELTARVSSGRDLPRQENSGHPSEAVTRDPQPVIYFSGEDGVEDTIVPRLRQAGANLGNVHIIDSDSNFRLDATTEMDALLEEIGPALFVIDTLSTVVGGLDLNKSSDAGETLKGLRQLSEKHDCSTVLVHHPNKSTIAKSTDVIANSKQLTAQPRSVLLVGNNEGDEEDNLSYLVHLKCNVALKGRALAYEVSYDSQDYRVPPGVVWHGFSDKTNEDLHRYQEQQDLTKSEKAYWAIHDFLKDGPKPSTEVLEVGMKYASERTVKSVWKTFPAVPLGKEHYRYRSDLYEVTTEFDASGQEVTTLREV